MFLKVNEAYTILKDPQSKQEYDKHLLALAARQEQLDSMSE